MFTPCASASSLFASSMFPAIILLPPTAVISKFYYDCDSLLRCSRDQQEDCCQRHCHHRAGHHPPKGIPHRRCHCRRRLGYHHCCRLRRLFRDQFSSPMTIALGQRLLRVSAIPSRAGKRLNQSTEKYQSSLPPWWLRLGILEKQWATAC